MTEDMHRQLVQMLRDLPIKPCELLDGYWQDRARDKYIIQIDNPIELAGYLTFYHEVKGMYLRGGSEQDTVTVISSSRGYFVIENEYFEAMLERISK